MKKLTSNTSRPVQGKSDESGFIPMMLSILAVIALIIYFVYTRVASVQH